jgi:hypothetical protein
MRIVQKIGQGIQSAALAVCGVVLYIPAAIGLAAVEMTRRREPEDDRWRFVLPGMVQCLGPTARKTDLWAHMNLTQYFSITPGATALDSDNCAFSRPCFA